MNTTLRYIKKIVVRFPILFDLILYIKDIPARDCFYKRMKIKSLGGGIFGLINILKVVIIIWR